MRCYLPFVLISLAAAPISAQGPARSGLSARLPVAHWERSFQPASATEWKKGMVIGAGIGAAVSVLVIALLANNGVGDSKHGATVWQVLGTLTIFSVTGGLIGSTVNKSN
jgi:hypothetical protein